MFVSVTPKPAPESDPAPEKAEAMATSTATPNAIDEVVVSKSAVTDRELVAFTVEFSTHAATVSVE